VPDDQQLPPGAYHPPSPALVRRSVRAKIAVWIGIAVLCAVAIVALALTTGWPAITPVTQVLSFLPVFTALTLVLVIGMLVIREWLIAALAAAFVALFATYIFSGAAVPPWPIDTGAPTVRIVTANLHKGDATPALVSRILADPPDLVFIQECTQECVAGIGSPVVRAKLPHQIVDADPSPAGAAILSAWPLEQLPVAQTSFSMPAATVSSPSGELTVRSAHPAPPVPGGVGLWGSELADLADFAAGSEQPLIMAGDFNATPYHRQYRDIRDSGALIEAVGSFPGTWRSDWPGFLRTPIDHILMPADWRAVTTAVEPLQGSDHALLSATLVRL